MDRYTNVVTTVVTRRTITKPDTDDWGYFGSQKTESRRAQRISEQEPRVAKKVDPLNPSSRQTSGLRQLLGYQADICGELRGVALSPALKLTPVDRLSIFLLLRHN